MISSASAQARAMIVPVSRTIRSAIPCERELVVDVVDR